MKNRKAIIRVRKAQGTLMYALIIVAVAGALATAYFYRIIQKNVQGSYKKAADQYGLEEQYKPTATGR